MNTTEQRDTTGLSVEEAIKISKIISSVSEERIPIILNVLEKAGVHIRGLDELEEWKALKDQAYIVDMDEFVSELTKNSGPKEFEVLLKPKEFEDICRQFNVKASCAKRALHRKELIRTTQENNKLNYTIPVWIDGKVERRVVILKRGKPKEVAE